MIIETVVLAMDCYVYTPLSMESGVIKVWRWWYIVSMATWYPRRRAVLRDESLVLINCSLSLSVLIFYYFPFPNMKSDFKSLSSLQDTKVTVMIFTHAANTSVTT